jgi:hypothetical protein
VKVMARAALAKKTSRKPSPKGKKLKAKVKVPSRKVSVDRRRGGKVSVLVQTRLQVAQPKAPPVVTRPIKLVGTALEQSRAFFDAHQLQVLSAALPLQPFVDEFVQRARNEGFHRVLVFPPVKVQRTAAEAMVAQLLRAPSPALAPSQQYSQPWLFDLRELALGEVHGRPEGPYAQAISDGPFPDDTRDRKAMQLEGRFQALSQSSLTVFEYMVWQRVFAEEHQDHRFDQYVEAHGHPTGWQWILDSRTPRGSIHAYWNAAKRRVEVGACAPANFNAKRGAHPTLIKPL